jgi:hypothetical protein
MAALCLLVCWWRRCLGCLVIDACGNCMQLQSPTYMISACRGWTLWRVAASQQTYCSRSERTRHGAWCCWRVRQLLRLRWQHQFQLHTHHRQQELLHQRVAPLLLKRKARLCRRMSAVAPAMRTSMRCWWCSGSFTPWIVCWRRCSIDATVLTDRSDQMMEGSALGCTLRQGCMRKRCIASGVSSCATALSIGPHENRR